MVRSSNGKLLQFRRSLRALGRLHREIVAVYLFGSEATHRAGPLSDLDVALLIDETRVPPRKHFNLRLELIGEVMHACRRSDVDVVLLNEASPLLVYEVIRGGQLLFERQHDARVGFEARAVQHFLDLEPFYRVSRSYLRRQLLKGGPRG